MRKDHLTYLKIAERRLREIRHLMATGSTAKARIIVELADREFAGDPLKLGMRFISARLKEDGVLGEVDTDAALEDFSFLMQYDNGFKSEGMVGRARMLYRIDPDRNADEVISLCRQAIKADSSVKAMMLMGFVFDNTKDDFNSAKVWYLRAYLRGLPWGLRAYAQSQWKRGNFIVSTIAHLVVCITSPFMVMVNGIRDPFK